MLTQEHSVESYNNFLESELGGIIAIPTTQAPLTTVVDPIEEFFTNWTVTKAVVFGAGCLLALIMMCCCLRYRCKRKRLKKEQSQIVPLTFVNPVIKEKPDDPELERQKARGQVSNGK